MTKPADVWYKYAEKWFYTHTATVSHTLVHRRTHTHDLEQHKTCLLNADNRYFTVWTETSELRYKLSQISAFWIMQ